MRNVFKHNIYHWWHPSNWWITIKSFFKSFKWAWQRAIYGVCDRDTWDADTYLLEYIYTLLKRFKILHNSYPAGMTEEEWNKELDNLINTFETALSDKDLPNPFIEALGSKVSEEDQKNIYDNYRAVESKNYNTFKSDVRKAFSMLIDELDNLWW